MEEAYFKTEEYKRTRKLSFLGEFRKIPFEIEELENKIKKLKEFRECLIKEYPELLDK